MRIRRDTSTANGRIWILAVLAAVLLTGCCSKEGAGKEREDEKEKWRYSVQEACGLTEKEYALRILIQTMSPFFYQTQLITKKCFLRICAKTGQY